MAGSRIAFLTLGCKVNSYETERCKTQLLEMGYEICEWGEIADAYVINTCTVTNVADRKSRKMLHRAKKLNPQALVVAAGCYVDSAGEQERKDALVDVWVSNKEKGQLAKLVHEKLKEQSENKQTMYEEEELRIVPAGRAADALAVKQHSSNVCAASSTNIGGLAASTDAHTRTYVKVQDGCNQFCSYCIIPYVRGRLQSRREQEIIEEVKRIADRGNQEIVLTGIHLSSYGVDVAGEKDFTKQKGAPLLQLAEKLADIEGIKRIRFGSLEPRLITEEFVQGISGIDKLCPHFHLSLQSGCDATLKRMNRHYTTEEYMEGLTLLRQYFENPAITTDVIVGFPQESEEEFACTKRFLEEAAFAGMHIFKYSVRQGTVAAKMSGQVDEKLKNTRSEQLIALEKTLANRYRRQFTGKRAEVLFEQTIQLEGRGYEVGYSREYIRVALPSESIKGNLHNEIRTVKIGEAFNDEFMECIE